MCEQLFVTTMAWVQIALPVKLAAMTEIEIASRPGCCFDEKWSCGAAGVVVYPCGARASRWSGLIARFLLSFRFQGVGDV
jgi:hypothetical protein